METEKQKKSYNVKPTEKQKKAFKKIVENGGNESRAMIEVGYSEATAKTPQKLTESKGFNELLKKYLPDEDLTKKHKEFLNSEKEEIGIKALDMGYKLKGSYAPEKSQNINVNANIKVDNKEAQEIAEKYEQELFNKLKNKDEKNIPQ